MSWNHLSIPISNGATDEDGLVDNGVNALTDMLKANILR